MREVLRKVKKVIVGVGLVFALRYCARNPNADFFLDSGQTNQQLEANYSDQWIMSNESQLESQSVNSIRVKTGSGTTLKVRNNAETTYDSFNLESEYDYLMGRGNDVILVFRSGKILVYYKPILDGNNRLNADLRIVKHDTQNPEQDMDITASVPEVRVLAKLYQIESFGVKVPKEVNLNFARKASTKLRLEYLNDVVGIQTVGDAHTAFAKFLDDPETDIFFGKFGEKYGKVFDGFYAFDSESRNMMFFKEEDAGRYELHAYMRLDPKKAKQLKQTHELFN